MFIKGTNGSGTWGIWFVLSSTRIHTQKGEITMGSHKTLAVMKWHHFTATMR